MDFFSSMEQYLTIENIQDFIKNYRALGPLPGLLLPFLEAILPILPLVLFVAANGAAYGFWYGSLFSWIGTCLGAVVVFWFFRKLSKTKLKRLIEKSKKIRSMLHWIERHGFAPIFLLLCFPFTPSSLVNVASGLSGLNFRSFLIGVMLGKMVMVFMISYVGDDWISIIKEPVKLLSVSGVILVLWFIGKRIEARLKTEKSSSESSS
jgi:uncharacterized membrane protein YdjX (TVP38/TMEM64 family)